RMEDNRIRSRSLTAQMNRPEPRPRPWAALSLLSVFDPCSIRGCCLLLFAVALGLVRAGECRAQLPLARLDRIFPLGGQAGSTVSIQLTGKDLEDVKVLHFDHPGLKAALVKGNEFRVSIAADVPAGTYDVRAVGRHGISGARLFAV